MPININSLPARGNILPLDIGMLANFQNQQLEFYRHAKAKEYQDFMQGEALADTSDLLLGSVKAYGQSDNEVLNRKRNVYTEALNKKIKEADGDYSKILPYLKQLHGEISKDVQYGDLGEIQTNYQTALENKKEVEKMIRKGELNPYMQHLAQSNYLNTVPKSLDISKEVSDYIVSSATTDNTLEEVINMAHEYARSRPDIIRQLGLAKQYSEDQYAQEMESITTAAINNYRTWKPDSDGASKRASQYLGSGTSPAFEQDVKKTIERGAFWGATNIGQTDKDLVANATHISGEDFSAKRKASRQADENFSKAVLDVDWFNDKDKRILTDHYKDTMSGRIFYELGETDNAGDLGEYYNDLKEEDQKQFLSTFSIVGDYEKNPYAPGAVAATAWTSDGQKWFVVGGNREGQSTDAATTLYLDMFNPETRLAGEGEYHTFQNPFGGEFQARIKPFVKDDEWDYDVEIKAGNQTETIPGKQFDRRIKQIYQ